MIRKDDSHRLQSKGWKGANVKARNLSHRIRLSLLFSKPRKTIFGHASFVFVDSNAGH